MSEYFTIGKIVNTQGIKGEVRVLPQTDDVTRFNKLEKVFLEIDNNLQSFTIESVRFHKQFVLLKFLGINDINDAEKFKNVLIKIHQDFAIPCEEGEYYIKDLYGIKVVKEDDQVLGTLEDIIFTGANDVYVIKNDEKSILVPAIKQCILNVDIENKIMKVKLLEGLEWWIFIF